MLRSAIYTVCALLMLASTANADVYRYTDEKGNIQYTDRPLTLPAERLSVASHRSDVVAIDERVGEDTKAMADRDKARQQDDKAKAEGKKSNQANAAAEAEACTKATQDYLNVMSGRRHYEEQPNGERHYLTKEEIDAARAAAKQSKDTLCH